MQSHVSVMSDTHTHMTQRRLRSEVSLLHSSETNNMIMPDEKKNKNPKKKSSTI
jgi:hypothetical protein